MPIFGFSVSLPDTAALSYGSSKLFQIVLPLSVYIVTKELPWLRQLYLRTVRRLNPNANLGSYEYRFDMCLGFTSWKIGCDFGFLLVTTSAAPLAIAFTFAGLIPYTILQYFVYYLLGTKIVLQGQPNPFKEEYIVRDVPKRPQWVRLVSKYLHESGNVTSYDVPLRQVFLKPFVDYGGLVITWSFYNVGLLFSQSGEFNLQPLVRFNFITILAFYLVNVFGYILGYNAGEWLYFFGSRQWDRVQQFWASLAFPTSISKAIAEGYRQFDRAIIERARPFCDRYGINCKWAIASGMGVISVIFLEPSMAKAIFSVSDSCKNVLFYTFAQLDPTHLQQVLTASNDVNLPSPELLTRDFAAGWNATFADSETLARSRP